MWFTFHEKIAFREGDWITHPKHDICRTPEVRNQTFRSPDNSKVNSVNAILES